MNSLLTSALLTGAALAVLLLMPTTGASALLVCAALAVLTILLLRRVPDDKQFLMRAFVGALLVRMIVGAAIYLLDLHAFFGGDAVTYDEAGYALLRLWQGYTQYQGVVDTSVSGWGMLYLVAIIYSVAGHNMLALQFVNSVIGAATVPIVYLCARHIFQNVRVARLAGLLVAFYPSLVLWSSQGLKDGPVVFLLAITMLATLKLGDRLTFKYLVVLIIGLLGILALRFYIFYMLIAAIGGGFMIGTRGTSVQNFVRQFALVVIVGLLITSFGISNQQLVARMENNSLLESVQIGRSSLAENAQSGFGQDVDVSTTGGALSAIPVGMTYLLFAPFPWQLANLRQSITLPEMVIWWASFPLLVMGLWFTLKYRLRQALPILMFTSMLTLAYSIMQGNIGTAYRQRSQLLVFYFIFVAVGYVLLKERSEDRQRQVLAAKQAALAARTPRVREPEAPEWKTIAENLSQKLSS